ncbi:MAG TPA: helix-turn-helix domain-containing protein [Microlunatus sp.]
MPKVTEQYRIDRRAAITAAASRCFVAKGVHQTSMADIIAESGLSAGAIYNHFRSKDEITVSVGASLVRGRLLGAIQAHDDQQQGIDPVELVKIALGTARTASVDRDVPLTSLIMQFWAEATVNPPMLALMQEQMVSIKASLLAPLRRWAVAEHGVSSRRSGRWADEHAQLLMSLVIGFVVQRTLFPDFDEPAYIRNAVATVGRIMAPAD